MKVNRIRMTRRIPISLLVLGICILAQEIAYGQLYNNGSIFYVNSGGILQVNGNAYFGSGSSFTNDGSVTITGDITNNQSMASANSGTLVLNGSSAQSLNGIGNYYANHVTLNNSNGVTINIPLKVNGTFSFMNGILDMGTPLATVTFTSNANVSGINSANDASHIHGDVIKEGVGNFTYPVGNGIKYQPVEVNATANGSGIKVRYNSSDAGSGFFSNLGTASTPLIAYNGLEYWDINPLSTAIGSVNIHWDSYNNVGILNVSDLRVAHKLGSNWYNEGGSGVGSIGVGSVLSNNLNSWGAFTLGSQINSPLPVLWLNVEGTLNSTNHANLLFKVNERNVQSYGIEKSMDGLDFQQVDVVKSNGNGINTYTYLDLEELKTTTFYRIKEIDNDGRYTYSTIIRLAPSSMSTWQAFPNPVNNNITINGIIPGERLILTDVKGTILFDKFAMEPSIQVDMTRYAAGVYLLHRENLDFIRLVKQ